MSGLRTFMGILGTLCLFAFIGIIIGGISVNYKYERDIGAYFDNAVDCITPECILTQLNAGYTAINNSGLTPDDYGAWIFKKPNNKMTFQYQHLDAIIERAEAVKQWKEQVYSNSSAGETMKDVYTEKMDNLRNYITAESYRSDWIAKSAWMLKYHFFYKVWVYLICIILIVLIFLFYAGAAGEFE